MEFFGRRQPEIVDRIEIRGRAAFRVRTREALELLRLSPSSRTEAPIGGACLACVRGGAWLNTDICLVVVPSNGRSWFIGVFSSLMVILGSKVIL